MEKSIRVRILGREYPLKVQHEEDEQLTRDIAAYVDAKMQAFKQAHPSQSDVVTAVFTALSIAEELYSTWEDEDRVMKSLESEINTLEQKLALATANGAEAH